MKILILITAFNVEKLISKVIDRLPDEIKTNKIYYEILIIDDASSDDTLAEIIKIKENFDELKITCLSNKKNLGYGGNQKIGYFYAIKNNFDYVVLLHGDGQYAPEKILEMLDPLIKNEADAVQGSRMINRLDALRGKMPIYKFFGNVGLTFAQNLMTGMKMSEYHSGYRAYRVQSLNEIPFHLNSNHFHFDTQIFLQLNILKKKIKEIPIPTFYGEEISSLKSISYGFAILNTTLHYYFQKYGIFYDKKFNFLDDNNSNRYVSKLDFLSTHQKTYETVKADSKILTIGCGNAYVEKRLSEKKNCKIVGIDQFKIENSSFMESFEIKDFETDEIKFESKDFDYILFLDVIEHLSNPEDFLIRLNNQISKNQNIELIISTPNVANIFIRMMLFFGFFNYGKKGILDKTHKRLFTLNTFKKILEESNFEIKKIHSIPPPFPLAIKNNFFANILLQIFKIGNIIASRLFAFQFLIIAKPKPNLEFLLSEAKIKENE